MIAATVNVIVNGLHRSTCVVLAVVIPITVQLSTRDLFLRFPDGGMEPSVTDTVKALRQPGTAGSAFSWEHLRVAGEAERQGGRRCGPRVCRRGGAGRGRVLLRHRGAFDDGVGEVQAQGSYAGPPLCPVQPLTGVVPAGGEASVAVTYRPAYGGAADCLYRLAVEGGGAGADGAPVLHLTGEEVDVALAVEAGATAEGGVEFGTLALGSAKEHPLTLAQHGTTAAVVTLQVRKEEEARGERAAA